MTDQSGSSADLRRQADAGRGDAALQLGSQLLMGPGGPADREEGASLISRAAAAGSLDALLVMATLAAAGAGRPQSWPDALDFLQQAAERGAPQAQAQLRLLAGGEAEDSWGQVRGRVDLDFWLARPARRPLSETPRIRVVEPFLPIAVCEWLIAAARGRLTPSTMYNPVTRRDEPHPRRTNGVFLFDLLRADVVLALVRARIAATVDIPLPCFEPTQVMHYAVGQEFAPHYDYLEARSMISAETARPYEGQRIATFLVYLNADYEDGETAFPKAGVRFKGQAGDAIYFANVDAQGAPDRLSLHAGTPPSRGEKWILSQWIHDRTFTGMLG